MKNIEELKSWFEDDKLYVGEYVKHKINQLDEPEVLSDKWIDDNSVYASSDGVTEEYVHVDELKELLVPKQEVLSQEWIDKHTEHHEYIGYAGVPVDDLENLLVPKQELPVIPKFVAEWIEETKPYNSLRVAFEYIAQRKRDNHDDEV